MPLEQAAGRSIPRKLTRFSRGARVQGGSHHRCLQKQSPWPRGRVRDLIPTWESGTIRGGGNSVVADRSSSLNRGQSRIQRNGGHQDEEGLVWCKGLSVLTDQGYWVVVRVSHHRFLRSAREVLSAASCGS